MATNNQRLSNLEIHVNEHSNSIRRLQTQLQESFNILKQSFDEKLKQMMKRLEALLSVRLQSLQTTTYTYNFGSDNEEIEAVVDGSKGNGDVHKVFDQRSMRGMQSHRNVLISGYSQDEDCLCVETYEEASKKNFCEIPKEDNKTTADESTDTIGKHLSNINVENNETSWRTLLEFILCTPGCLKYINGVIPFEESLYQSNATDKSFVDVLKEGGVLPGIKVDKGTTELVGTNGDTTTQGLVDLGARCTKYSKAAYKVFDENSEADNITYTFVVIECAKTYIQHAYGSFKITSSMSKEELKHGRKKLLIFDPGGGNIHAYNQSMNISYNRSMSNSSVSRDKFSNSAYALVENGDKNKTNGLVLKVNVSMIFNDSTAHDHHRPNPEGSLLLTRNLLCIAIFNISYIRGFCPENYFNDKSVSGIEMKIEKLMPMDAESRRLIDWIEKGVYDAL